MNTGILFLFCCVNVILWLFSLIVWRSLRISICVNVCGGIFGGCHLIELNNFSIINFLMLNIQSCRARHYISTCYASLIPSLFSIWDIFGTSSLKIESICFACSVKWFGAR